MATLITSLIMTTLAIMLTINTRTVIATITINTIVLNTYKKHTNPRCRSGGGIDEAQDHAKALG